MWKVIKSFVVSCRRHEVPYMDPVTQTSPLTSSVPRTGPFDLEDSRFPSDTDRRRTDIRTV